MQTGAALKGQSVVCVCAEIALATVDYYEKPTIIYVAFHFAGLLFIGSSKCYFLLFVCLFMFFFLNPTFLSVLLMQQANFPHRDQ